MQQFVDIDVVTADHLAFLDKIEVINPDNNILDDSRQGQRHEDSSVVFWVAIFHDCLSAGEDLPELYSHLGIYCFSIHRLDIFALEDVH